MDRDHLLAALRHDGITDNRVLSAIAAVPRDEFVAPQHQPAAWENHPLPIGCGQTISQPLIVAYMTELLDLRPGDHVLDVGTGCGYQAAVLAQLGCQVLGVELVPELAARARATLTRLGYCVDVATGDGYEGRPDDAPFDGILVAAAAAEAPAALLDQLRLPERGKRGGRLVIPIENWDGAPGQRLVLIERTPDDWRRQVLDRVRFVPLVRGG